VSKFNPSSEAKLGGAGVSGLMPGDPLPDTPMRASHSAGGRPDEPLITEHIPVDGVESMDDARAIAIATQCFNSSEDYFNASHRTRVMDAMARWRSQHPKGSKYWSAAFDRRSKLVRPKTRSTMRKREAATIAALFSTNDVVNIAATNNGDIGAAKDARIQGALLNIRLNDDDRWYKLCVGAIQDADRQGIVCAVTEWEYREATRYYDIDKGDGTREKHAVKAPIVDRPNYRLIPIENLRMSPSANWMDPVNSSGYLIEMRPMLVCEIKEYMKNPRARLKYRQLSDNELMSGTRSEEWDPIRIQREGNKQDRYDRQGQINDYATVWVHRNIIRIQGEDYVYDTVGTNLMLSDVVPLSAVDPRGYRPYVIGSAMLESHNPFPDGAVSLMGPMQDAIDVNANLRVDQNQIATSGRMFVKRGAGVDLHALARFSPGSAVEMDDPTSVRWDHPNAPPSSNYEENSLLNTEIDDLVGNFSQGSVAGNKQLNETVGGMKMLGEAGAQLTEFDLHTLAKTLFEPLLRQILDLEKLWETDRGMAAMIGSKFAASEREYWSALQTSTKLTIDMGYGATNPMARLDRLSTGLKTMGEFFPYLMMMADQSELTTEIFGACGYPDASRFFPFLDQKDMDDPKYKTLIMQLNQMRMLSFPHIAEAQGRQQQGQAQAQGAIQAATIRAQSAERIAAMNNEAALNLRELELALAKVDLSLKTEDTQIKRDALMLQREKISNDISVSQQTLILEAEATSMAPDPLQQGALPANSAGLQQRLMAPGSGDVSLQNTKQLFGNAQNIPDPGGQQAEATGKDLANMFPDPQAQPTPSPAPSGPIGSPDQGSGILPLQNQPSDA
jgi:hypothetical protein